MIRDQIINALKEVTGSEDIKLDMPSVKSHGDYASGVALTLAKRQNKNPLELAKEIVSKFGTGSELKKYVGKIEVAGPGFINFWVSDEALFQEIEKVLEAKEAYGKSDGYQGKKVMVEYTDPNPFKEFHIGHLYSNAVGESVARLLEASGAQVKRANYQGDVGMHVAKALWGLKKKMAADKLTEEDLEKKDIVERIHYMGQAYALGATAYEEDEMAKSEIEKINKQVFEKDVEVYSLYQKGRQWSLDYFETIYTRLGTKFDYYYFESEAGARGRELVLEYLKKGIFQESQGAIIFPGEKYGLHTRVFINSEGLPTYEAKELGLAPRKFRDFAYDISIIVTGNEINEYFKVLLKALELIKPELAEKTVHLGHGMVRLPEGKMSSRTGKIIAGDRLIEEVALKIVEIGKNPDRQLADKVAVAAIKGSFLQASIGQDIIFDVSKSISTEGNSGPYLQYTHARASSILSKKVPENQEVSGPLDEKEQAVARVLIHFPEIVKDAAKNYSPHLLANYLYDLAGEYNSFYNSERVIGSERETARLLLTKATGQVIKNGLSLLGIEAPEKM